MFVEGVDTTMVTRGSPNGGPFVFDDVSRACGHSSGADMRKWITVYLFDQ
jgi:hypothetical protein